MFWVHHIWSQLVFDTEKMLGTEKNLREDLKENYNSGGKTKLCFCQLLATL